MARESFSAAVRALTKELEQGVAHYEKTAPTVSEYLDGLYRRLHGQADEVRMSELMFVDQLQDEGIYMHPNHAANAVYHLMSRLGMDTTGHAGF